MTTQTRPTAAQIAPGPRGHRLWGSQPDLQRDPIGLYMAARQQYGDVVRFRALGGYIWHALFHPEDVDYVLRTHQQNYPKGYFNLRISALVGHGLLTSEGPSWLQQRRLIQPAFHRQRLAQLAAVMTRASEALVDTWRAPAAAAQPVDVHAAMMHLTLDIVGQALFSSDVSGAAGAVGQALGVSLEHVNYRMMRTFSLPERVPTPRNRRFARALGVLDGVVAEIIAERRRTGLDNGDLLSMLLHARDEDSGATMSDRQVRDEVMTLILAGHETTANALSWAWHLVGRTPAAEGALHEELDAVLGGRTPTVEDVPRLPYTRMVIEETMRLYPPVWSMGRQTEQADEIRGYHIPAGTIISLSQYVTHRHPEFWEAPAEFRPERWTAAAAATRPRFAYFPFGGGPRLCIGNNFALMEAQLILATLAQHYRLRPASAQPVVTEPLITLRPRGGLPMIIAARRTA